MSEIYLNEIDVKRLELLIESIELLSERVNDLNITLSCDYQINRGD